MSTNGFEEMRPVHSDKKHRMSLISWTLLLLILFGFLGVTAYLNMVQHNEQQFSYLAQSFLNGNLAFQEIPGQSWADATPFEGQFYWPLGPLPAVLLMPFEFLTQSLGVFFYQGYLQFFLVSALLGVIYRIARCTGYHSENSLYLAFAFLFATAFLGVALWSWSWYFSHVITSLLLFLIILEMITRRRAWLLGALFALVLATRATAVLGLVWCIAEYCVACDKKQKKIVSLISLIMPVVVIAIFLLLYNYARFHNPFDQGYASQMIPQHAEVRRALGIFSLQHLPGNLYYLFLAAPSPVWHDRMTPIFEFPYFVANPWGMSIWITSPLLLILFGLKLRDRTSLFLLLTVTLIAVPIILYYGIGFRQFGYRYALDFLPFLYYLLLRNYHQQRGELTIRFKAIAIVSALFNFYLFSAHYIFGAP